MTTNCTLILQAFMNEHARQDRSGGEEDNGSYYVEEDNDDGIYTSDGMPPIQNLRIIKS